MNNKLKRDILSLLTDKNVGKINLESEAESFGALLAYGQAFKDVCKLLNNYKD